MISISCSCRGDFWVRDRLAGREAACPACGTKLAVPPLESVKKKMTPASCSCGEVFWSSAWQIGKVSRCPICGDAVGPSRSKSGITTIQAPESRNAAKKMPETLSTWASEDSPPPRNGEPKSARGSAAVAPRDRQPPPTRGISPRTRALAAGGLVLLAVALISLFRSCDTASPEGPPGTSLVSNDPVTPKGGGGGGSPVTPKGGDAEEDTRAPDPDPKEGNGSEPDEREPGPNLPLPGPGPGPEPLLKILVPAYFFPAGEGLEDWNRLIEASPQVPIIAIVNPGSGPGDMANPDYADIVARAKEAGVEVIGYVNTDYGKRPRLEIEADIDRWVQFYPDIQGIFFDAQASGAEKVGLYAALRAYVRQKVNEAIVIGNPGTICDEGYFSRSAVDAAIMFENKAGFDGFELPAWAPKYQARPFAALPYFTKTEERMKEAARQAVLKRIGYFYATDGETPNPWDHLPPYWTEEVEAVKRLNQGKAP